LILILDNFDSFTYNLLDYFEQIKINCRVFRNDAEPLEIFEEHYEGIVFSPGPGKPSSSGCMMEVLKYYEKTHPILGICLGHQAIGQHFGADLVSADKPMHGKISTITHNNDILFDGLEEKLQVVRYHSLVLKNVSRDLEVTASTEKNEIMGIKHKYLPIHGVQFHPEAILTEKGSQMLHNWARYYKLDN
jgi:anthranilate synthase component II